jgi:hypothetical protein
VCPFISQKVLVCLGFYGCRGNGRARTGNRALERHSPSRRDGSEPEVDRTISGCRGREIRCEYACRNGKQGVAGSKCVFATFINTHIIRFPRHLFTYALPLHRILAEEEKERVVLVDTSSLLAEIELPAKSHLALTDKLEKARCKLEERFLAAGEILSQSIMGIEALIASLDTLATTLSSETVVSTTTGMTIAAAKLNALPSSHASRVARVASLNGARKQLAVHVSDMRRSLAYMRAFVINIKIVAGDLGAAGMDFSRFADDLAGSLAKGEEELKHLETELSQLQRGLEGTATQDTLLGLQIRTLLPAIPRQLSESAAAMSKRYKYVATMAGSVAELARAIHQCVARILCALQIGDITRQRIEHIQSGIIHLDANAAISADDRQRLIAATACALLSTQLAAAREDFDRETSEIGRSMTDMADRAADLLKLHDLAYSSDDGRNGGFLHGLGASVDRALALVGKVQDADLAAIVKGKNTAEAARRLGMHIKGIQLLKTDIQYMALNATVKCAQIGDVGRPLSVITTELRLHAKNLENAATGGLTALDTLSEATASLTGGAQAKDAEESDGAAADRALEAAAAAIRQARDHTEKDIEAIAAKGDAVMTTLSLSSERLNFKSEIGGLLEEIAGELEVLCEGALHRQDELPEKLEQSLGILSENYTMAQERDIYREFLSDLGLSQAPQEVPANDLDSVLF